MRFVGRGKSTHASLPFGVLLAVIALAAVSVFVSACGSGGSGDKQGEKQGVVEITCGTYCVPLATNPGTRVAAEVVKRFNEKYRGRYHIKTINDPGMLNDGSGKRTAYYQRLALADGLPDLFEATSHEGLLLGKTGKLMDFAPFLEQDSEWKSTFHEGALAPGTDEAGHTWSFPITRDAIGIFYNKAIFREAGISEFPRTWDEVTAACQKVKAIGRICWANDGLWTTQLLWSNLIGTQPGGADFLTKGIKTDDDFSDVPQAVKASEMIKQWEHEGFMNKDSLAGNYQNAAGAYMSGKAALFPNGPWDVPAEINNPKVAIKGLYKNTGYEVSPGWTADDRGVVAAGEFSFSSGAKDERKQEAVVAFLKFYEEHAQSYLMVKVYGSYPAVKFVPTAAESKTLEPLALKVNQSSTSLETYPHAMVNAPQSFTTVFPNLWPAYVKGQMSTQEFLSKLASDMHSKTAG
jgi:raffinose/stachyose/melibiose transport system substrate-binding protein